MTFEELGLDEVILRAVSELGFESPTPIQAAAIPVMLQTDDDILGLAQTGTGKTAAFGLPLLHHLMQAPFRYEGVRTTRALVLAPTRELCMQISKDLKLYGKYSKLKVVAVYGGEDIRRQLSQLDVTPEIIVATPGRLIDLVRRGKVMLSNIEYLVLDEADEMLNMGFKDDLETILKETPSERRTLLFSATMPKEISAIARNYMRSARELQIGERNAGTENVDHIYYVCKAEHRYDVLKRIVDLNPDIYGIVFCRTKADCQVVSEKLIKDGYNADALHGDLTQVARDNVMQRFRLGAVQLLVATDVAARGLDVHNLTHVINYQLPDDSEVYTHRSGRTGRAGKRGISVSIVHIREVRRINELERLLKRTFKRERIPSGLDVCRKQLFNQIVRLQSVDTAMLDEDTTAAANGLKEAMSMLDYMPKEELIKRFVALEFNRFLAYYKDAVDLNVETKTAKKSTDKSAPGKPSGRGKKVRMKINVGTSDGINTRSFLALVNDTTRDRSITIGDIEVQKNYTFFDLFLDQKQKVVNAFKIYEDLFVVEAKGMKPRENSDSDNYSGRRRKNDNDGGRGKGGANGHSDKPWRKGRR